MSDAVAAAGVFILAACAPFEMTAPLLRLPGQSISNLEAALLAVCVAWSASLTWSSRRRSSRVPLAGVGTAFILAMATAAALAPTYRVNAMHMVGRLAAAGAVYVLAVQGLTGSGRLRVAIAVCVGSGVVVAVLTILEYAQVRAVLDLLRLFRPSVTAVGAQVRAGGPLQYPTIASMYLEVAFALGLGLLYAAVDARSRAATTAWFVGLLIIGEAVTLTFTRAGLITMATSLAAVFIWRWRDRRVDPGARLVVVLAVAVGALLVPSRSAQSLWLRVTSEGQDNWYRARIEGPLQLSLGANTAEYVPVRVFNAGRVTWDSADVPPIYFSYHWLDADGTGVVAWEGERTRFAAPVLSGSGADVIALVRGPREPGRYRIEWDVVQEGRLWFSTEHDAPDPTTSGVIVTGSGTGAAIVTRPRPGRAVRPGRLVLWRAALRMVMAHPLLGVGPDNFRLLYGSYSGLAGADLRTHANNMYLEVLAGGGFLAFGAFAVFIGGAYALFAAGLRGCDAGRAIPFPADGQRLIRGDLAIGVSAAGLAIAIHAVFDSFLSFAPTYILFALVLGCAAALASGVEKAA